MKLVSYLDGECENAGIFYNNRIYPVVELNEDLPDNMMDLLMEWGAAYPELKKWDDKIKSGDVDIKGIEYDEDDLLAPVPFPTSMRDGYAFRQHVSTARRNRGVDMIEEFDQFPVFYLTNHNAVYGPGEIDLMPDHFHKLDFELECAIVIGKEGRNVRAEDADQYIAGYMVMNDFSARRLQMEEMKLNLGPAKGKDFATTMGPFLVTPDELEKYKTNPREGHVGNAYALPMKAFVNGKQVSAGNLKDMDWTFAEIIERVSYGVDIYPGDVIGSGTVGTGCFLELNGSARLENPDHKDQWLQEDDEVVLEIGELGKLRNIMVLEDDDFSILDRKKNV